MMNLFLFLRFLISAENHTGLFVNDGSIKINQLKLYKVESENKKS